jgi:hypothetical protein
MFREAYKLWSSSLCNLLQSPANFEILSSAPFSHASSLYILPFQWLICRNKWVPSHVYIAASLIIICCWSCRLRSYVFQIKYQMNIRTGGSWTAGLLGSQFPLPFGSLTYIRVVCIFLCR